MKIEHTIIVNAPAECLFAIYADVSHWNVWDPDTKASAIDGPFEAGTHGTLTPTQGNSIRMVLTSVVPHQSFTVESRLPLFRMVFEHELLPMGSSTKVIHRVIFSGGLAFILGRIIGSRVNRGLPVTLATLKRLAEHQHQSAT